MGYPAITRRFTASSTSTGNMNFKMDEVGFFTDSGRTAVYVGDAPHKSWHVTLSGADSVQIQGNNNDPDVAADWFTLSTASSTEVVTFTDALQFMRCNVNSVSGTVTVNFLGAQS